MAVIKFILNGQMVEVDTDPTKRLLDVLREGFALTSVKEGCGEGECGACSVLVNHLVVNTCVTPLGNVDGKSVVTMEGFSKTERFGVLKDAFEALGAVQCGACTPGMIIAAESLLHRTPHPNEAEIMDGLSGNLCRCTGYNMIIKAITTAAERGDGLW